MFTTPYTFKALPETKEQKEQRALEAEKVYWVPFSDDMVALHRKHLEEYLKEHGYEIR